MANTVRVFQEAVPNSLGKLQYFTECPLQKYVSFLLNKASLHG